MGSRSLFKPRGRVLNGFTAHSQVDADPLPITDPLLAQEVNLQQKTDTTGARYLPDESVFF